MYNARKIEAKNPLTKEVVDTILAERENEPPIKFKQTEFSQEFKDYVDNDPRLKKYGFGAQ